MKFLDSILIKLRLKNPDDLDNETAEDESILSNDSVGDVSLDDESPEDEHQGLNKQKIIITAIGTFLLIFGWTFFSSHKNTIPEQNVASEENIVKVPNLSQNPASALPDTYGEIVAAKKGKQEKNSEQQQTPPPVPEIPIVQEQPIISEYDRNEERQYQEEQSRILSSKIAFDLSSPSENTQIISAKYKKSVNNAKSGWTLTAGSIIPATMLTGATSDMPNADVVAQVRQDVYDSKTGRHILIPQGSKILGTSGTFASRGNKRLGIVFNRLIFPNGTSIDLPNQNGIDGPGMPGLKDRYSEHSSTMVRTAILSAAFSAAAQSATRNSGGTDYTASAGQEAVSGSVADVMDVADQIISRDANLQPTISIRPGVQFAVFLNKDFVLKEYKE